MTLLPSTTRGTRAVSGPVALAFVSIALLVTACNSNLSPVAATAGPTVTPRPTATPKPTPVPMDVTKEAFTDSVAQGGDASVTVRTEASAACEIEVLYDSGPSQASGLDPKTASSAGKAIWSWRVGGKTKTGTYPITVTCRLGDKEGVLELELKVTP